MRTLISKVVAGVIAAGLTAAAPAMAEWPERPLTIIVPAGAGGGSDATARLLGLGLEQELGQPVNIVNQGQGGGAVGFNTLTSAKADGYTLGVIFNFAHYSPMGQGDFDAEDLTAIGQFNFDPAGFHVSAKSEWQDLPQALEAIKADPAKYDIACGGGCGGSWPLAVAALLQESGADLTQVRMISGQGAAAALQEMVAGGFDVVPSSVPEAGSLIDAGLVRGLAIFGNERLEAYPDIPTLKEETGMDLELGAWRGLVGPAGLDEDIQAKLQTALENVYNSEQFQTSMTERGFGLRWRSAEDFAQFMQDEEVSVRELIQKMGL